MKLSTIEDFVEVSEDFESKSFGIRKEDEGKILNILRSKMYENPIESICREISCNSRDANREAGKPNIPITIEISSGWMDYESEKVISFCDSGIGISKDRMWDIFCNYGASTKTNSNKLTGGFGLGAKTPFSYTDSFFVETICESKKYIYSACLDQSGSGSMILLSEEICEDKTGTKIIIPIKDKDIKSFESAVVKSCKYWKIKPNLINFRISIEPETETIAYYDSYWIHTPKTPRGYHNCTILIDDIAYELSTDIKHDLFNTSYSNKKRIELNLILPFKIGELSISANRETLYLDELTLKKIKKRVETVKLEVKTDSKAKADLCETKFEYYLFVQKERRSDLFNFLKLDKEVFQLEFKGKQLIHLDYLKSSIGTNYSRMTIHSSGYSFDKPNRHNKGIDFGERIVESYIYSGLVSDTSSNIFKPLLLIVKDCKLKTSKVQYLRENHESSDIILIDRKNLNNKQLKLIFLIQKFYNLKQIVWLSEIPECKNPVIRESRSKVSKEEILICTSSCQRISKSMVYDKRTKNFPNVTAPIVYVHVPDLNFRNYNHSYSMIGNKLYEIQNVIDLMYLESIGVSIYEQSAIMVKTKDLPKFELDPNCINVEDFIKAKEFIESANLIDCLGWFNIQMRGYDYTQKINIYKSSPKFKTLYSKLEHLISKLSITPKALNFLKVPHMESETRIIKEEFSNLLDRYDSDMDLQILISARIETSNQTLRTYIDKKLKNYLL